MMTKPELIAALEQLTVELAALKEVDERSKQSLVELAADVRRQLSETQAPSIEAAPAYESFRDQVQRFEAEHPQLAETIGVIADGLARLGI
jgi:hypothetical protein